MRPRYFRSPEKSDIKIVAMLNKSDLIPISRNKCSDTCRFHSADAKHSRIVSIDANKIASSAAYLYRANSREAHVDDVPSTWRQVTL